MSLLTVSALTDSSFSSIALSGAAGGGVTVDLDASLLVQVVLFVVLLFALKPALFDPMMRLFEEREKRIEGTRARASKEDERSAKALAKYEAVLAKAREAGGAERDALRSSGAKREAEALAKVRAETASTLEQGRSSIANEAKAARQELASDARTLGREIAGRVLGREVLS